MDCCQGVEFDIRHMAPNLRATLDIMAPPSSCCKCLRLELLAGRDDINQGANWLMNEATAN